MNYFKHFFLIGIFALQCVSCDDIHHSSIPDYPVQLNLDLISLYPTFINSYNKYLIFEQKKYMTDYIGYGGILVYSGFDGNYYAFDLSCPYESKSNIRVKPNDIGQAICDSCKTVFQIAYGNGDPMSGPAKEGLKRYRAVLNGYYLHVSN